MAANNEACNLLPRVVVLSSPGMGHLIPLSEFARRLAATGRLAVTLVAQTQGPAPAAQKSLLRSLQQDGAGRINVVSFPPPPLELIPAADTADANLQLAIFATITHNLPAVRRLLQAMPATSLAAVVADMFCAGALDMAREMGVPGYLLSTINCLSIAFGFAILKLHHVYLGEYRDLPEPLRLPGPSVGTSISVDSADFPEILDDRRNEAYAGFLYMVECFRSADGILVNSFEEMERGTMEALAEDQGAPPVYAVGPLVRQPALAANLKQQKQHRCLRWLDEQPNGSVVYVSFGSGGTLTAMQTEELALGLEMSGKRFLWVAKSPNEHDASGTFFDVAGDDDDLGFLPGGFVERTRELGLVLTSWVPQVEILRHAATGGFISHCGWNSSLESIAGGVPMIAWPLYAEQKLNASMLSDAAKVALRPINAGGDGELVVLREEVSRVVRCLMEGEEGKEIRSRMGKLRDQACRAMEEGGSSFNAVSKITEQWS